MKKGQGPAGARNRKKLIIFNNPRSSIKPGSAPDPIIYLESLEEIIYIITLQCYANYWSVSHSKNLKDKFFFVMLPIKWWKTWKNLWVGLTFPFCRGILYILFCKFWHKKVWVSHLTFIEKIYTFSTCHICLCGAKEWHLIGDWGLKYTKKV